MEFVVAAYDANGRMVACNLESKSLDVSERCTLTVSYAARDGVSFLRAFVLSPDTLSPLRRAWTWLSLG